jgi:hypothetical protein
MHEMNISGQNIETMDLSLYTNLKHDHEWKATPWTVEHMIHIIEYFEEKKMRFSHSMYDPISR